MGSFAAHPPGFGLSTVLLDALTVWADHYGLTLILRAATGDVRDFYNGGGFQECEGISRVLVRQPRNAQPDKVAEPVPTLGLGPE